MSNTKDDIANAYYEKTNDWQGASAIRRACETEKRKGDSMDTDIKELIKNTIKDLVADFLYYDRKEDEELGVEMIENAVEDSIVTVGDMVDVFQNELAKNL